MNYVECLRELIIALGAAGALMTGLLAAVAAFEFSSPARSPLWIWKLVLTSVPVSLVLLIALRHAADMRPTKVAVGGSLTLQQIDG